MPGMTRSTARRREAARALLVTADPDLLDDLLRLGSAAGVELEVAHDLPAARPRYGPAPVVLIGGDLADGCLRARLPRRPGVVVVCRDAADPRPWDLAQPLGAEHVALLPAAETWLVERLAGIGRGPAPGAGRVIAVLGGRGGAGASVLAAGLAVTACRVPLRTLLIDADPLGGGADLLLGWEELRGLRWPQLARASGPVDPAALVDALPRRGDLVVLSCARDIPDEETPVAPALPADAMAVALDAGRRGRDLVVVDLPRRLDEAAAVVLQDADRVLLVVPAELRAAAAAARVADVALAYRRELSLVVREPAPGRLSAAELARAVGLPLAGTLRPEPRLAAALERGEAPGSAARGPLATLCGRLIREVLP
ncbi:septum formation initiator [Catellatospora bangladeshensis]|uniref:Septum formation initiator n=2 Tax=Catellatospora bangladeshensis TaxID=310355 RepID=A0A8J3JSN5_9ACTN|nr:septum formation initiator [Catellatospora bangladeshensis]